MLDLQNDRQDNLKSDVYASVERVNINVVGDDAPFFGITTRELPDVSLLSAAISPMSPHRTRAQATDGKDDLVFAFIENGKVRFTPQGGAELDLDAGDAYVGLNTRASTHRLVDSPRFFDVTIPRSVLDPRVRARDYAALGVQQVLPPALRHASLAGAGRAHGCPARLTSVAIFRRRLRHPKSLFLRLSSDNWQPFRPTGVGVFPDLRPGTHPPGSALCSCFPKPSAQAAAAALG